MPPPPALRRAELSFTCSAACVVPPHADVLAETLAQRDGHRTDIPELEELGWVKHKTDQLSFRPQAEPARPR